MSDVNITININPEPPSKPVNKFYPFWVYSYSNPMERAKKRLEMVLEEISNARTEQ